MNIVVLFEGTGQGVEGKFTNVTRLKEMCIEDEQQRLHLESGPGTHFGAYLFGKVFGADCREILRSARRWFQQHYMSLPPAPPISNVKPQPSNIKLPTPNAPYTSVYLFGFSRGALLARKFAEWLDKLGIKVAYLGVWDTVDSAMKIDVGEMCPEYVEYARHAVARDECRRYFKLVPMRFADGQGEQRVFPGVHSDVGGLYEDNHDIADATLAWIVEPAIKRGLRIKEGIELRQDWNLETLPTHDSKCLISNLWGALGTSPRSG